MFAGGPHRANMEGGAVETTMPQASYKLGLEEFLYLRFANTVLGPVWNR